MGIERKLSRCFCHIAPDKENFNTTKILSISRKENLIADEIYKTIDYDTWRTIESFFQPTNIWGKVAFDRLADNHNTNI